MAKSKRTSAGILLHRWTGNGLEVFLVHPGGPFWAGRDDGAWTLPSKLKSDSFSIEWPPRSGKRQEFPEVDRGEWFPVASAFRKILAGHAPLLSELQQMLAAKSGSG